MRGVSPKLDGLRDDIGAVREQLRALQVRSSVWSAVGSALPVVIAIAMALLMKLWR
jgi:hypothetical protein